LFILSPGASLEILYCKEALNWSSNTRYPWFDSIQRTASGRVLNSTKANPREVPRRESVCGSTTPEKTARTSLLLLFLFHKAFLSTTSSQHENVIEFSVTLPLKSAMPTLNSHKMHRNVTCVSPYPYLFSG